MKSYNDAQDTFAEWAEECSDLPSYTHARDMVPYEVHCPSCGETADAVDDAAVPEPVYKCRECAKLFMVREVVADQPVWTVRELDLEEEASSALL